MSKWIHVSDELPPCDGLYEVAKFGQLEFDQILCFYNGYGFLYKNSFIDPTCWRVIPQRREKKYGKVEK